MKKMKKLYLLCGPSGAGKSTFAKEVISEPNDVYISRDEVRLRLVKNDEAIFSHEDEVFATFVKEINEAINTYNNSNVIADATHLTEKARNRVLNRLNIPNNVAIIPVVIYPDLATCLEQNKKRSGRALVPSETIADMYHRFRHPKYDHRHYDAIMEVY